MIDAAILGKGPERRPAVCLLVANRSKNRLSSSVSMMEDSMRRQENLFEMKFEYESSAVTGHA